MVSKWCERCSGTEYAVLVAADVLQVAEVLAVELTEDDVYFFNLS